MVLAWLGCKVATCITYLWAITKPSSSIILRIYKEFDFSLALLFLSFFYSSDLRGLAFDQVKTFNNPIQGIGHFFKDEIWVN
jgi:hypothetical protein